MLSSDELWETTDPLSRRGVLRSDIVQDRSAAGKHLGADAMTIDEVKKLISSPSRIDISSKIGSRNIYYRYERATGKPPYHRAVVEFGDRRYSPDGSVISWSRIGKPVTGTTIFLDPRNNP